MKLLFPLIASLMLQYQVKSEFLVVKKCLKGFGKCRDSCLVGETKVKNCKSKKCCIGPKVIELIKSYLRHEIPHIPDNDLVEMLKNEKKSREEVERKHTLGPLSQIQDANPLLNITSAIVPNASPLKSVTSRTNTVSTKRHTKQIRDSAHAALWPRPGPP